MSGIVTGLIVSNVVIIIAWYCWCIADRYDQAGRIGYGFEKTGIERIKTALALFWKYDRS